MKTLGNIRVFLICLIILGLFASFAQNEYGLGTIIKWCNGLIGLSFLAEFFLLMRLKLTTRERIGRMLEALALFLFFFGMFARSNRWPGAGISIMAGGGLAFFYYLADGIIFFTGNKKRNAASSFITLMAFFIAACGYLAMTFKQQHWPFAGILFLVTGILTGLAFLISVFLRKIKVDGERIHVFKLAEKTRVRLGFSFIYVSIWGLYVLLNVFGIAPALFTLLNPPAYTRMIEESQRTRMSQEQRTQLDTRIETYYNKYETFFIRRYEEEEKK